MANTLVKVGRHNENDEWQYDGCEAYAWEGDEEGIENT